MVLRATFWARSSCSRLLCIANVIHQVSYRERCHSFSHKPPRLAFTHSKLASIKREQRIGLKRAFGYFPKCIYLTKTAFESGLWVGLHISCILIQWSDSIESCDSSRNNQLLPLNTHFLSPPCITPMAQVAAFSRNGP